MREHGGVADPGRGGEQLRHFLPLRDTSAHLPDQAPQLRQLPLQVLGDFLLPLHYLLLPL